ncbi:hypothetical protein [Vibrio halioticoli]|uniref:hypothetical protein n=1 Tax=Vibrio halioticoli TaxID=71388 RepID=UPI000E5A95A7|nr:hypothetical protein [Vibrio halioticoli]
MSIFENVHKIKHPTLTKENWGEKQPLKRMNLLGKEVDISQPSSTFWVYLLGVLVTLAGVVFLVMNEGEMSRIWWGISLVLWGVGALIAGTSYQAFGYEMKAKYRDECSWTTWWEVIYLIFQQVSMNAMVVAIAYTSIPQTSIWFDIFLWYAGILTVAYTIITFWGAFTATQSVITFEFMMMASLPSFIAFCLINTVSYIKTGATYDLLCMISWVLIFSSYYFFDKYWKKGVGEILWEKGIWFSENDVLHVILVVWSILMFFLPAYTFDLTVVAH